MNSFFPCSPTSDFISARSSLELAHISSVTSHGQIWTSAVCLGAFQCKCSDKKKKKKFFLFFFLREGQDTENEIRFKVIISSHSLDSECALMSLTKRGFIASPPGIAQSLSYLCLQCTPYANLFCQCARAQNCPYHKTPGGSTSPVV